MYQYGTCLYRYRLTVGMNRIIPCVCGCVCLVGVGRVWVCVVVCGCVGVCTKLGFKPMVMYFMRNYATKLIPVRQLKGWKRAPLFDFINPVPDVVRYTCNDRHKKIRYVCTVPSIRYTNEQPKKIKTKEQK